MVLSYYMQNRTHESVPLGAYTVSRCGFNNKAILPLFCKLLRHHSSTPNKCGMPSPCSLSVTVVSVKCRQPGTGSMVTNGAGHGDSIHTSDVGG